jgi:hypothetical protein
MQTRADLSHQNPPTRPVFNTWKHYSVNLAIIHRWHEVNLSYAQNLQLVGTRELGSGGGPTNVLRTLNIAKAQFSQKKKKKKKRKRNKNDNHCAPKQDFYVYGLHVLDTTGGHIFHQFCGYLLYLYSRMRPY